MTFAECIPFLNQFKRIRRAEWSVSSFIVYDTKNGYNNILMSGPPHYDLFYVYREDMIATDWEICK